MERIINITIRDKIASSDGSVYVCGNNDFTINFDFDDEWSEFVHKTARFIFNGTFIDIVFSGNQCAVPIISDTYNILVGVYAGDLRTTTPARIGATKSILCGTNAPADPAPDVYAQMVELFNAGLDESRTNANEAKASEEAAAQSAVNAARSKEAAEQSAADAADSASRSESSKASAGQYSNSANEAALKAKASEESAARSAANAKDSEITALQALNALLIVDTASGKVAAAENAAHMPIRKLTVNDGAEVETVKVIGKNFFHRDYATSVTNIGVTVEWDAENQEFIFNGTTTAPGDIKIVNPMKIDWVPGEMYAVSVRKVSGTAILATGTAVTTYGWGIFQDNAAKYIRGATGNSGFLDVYNFTNTAFALDAKRNYIFYFQCWRPGTVFDNYRVKVQIERGSKVTDWEPYREESVAFADAQSLMLQKGCNNIIPVPSADITADYVVDLQLYIDKKLAEMQGV